MMSSPQPGHTHTLYKPFFFWDTEAIAVVAILLGLFQMLLAIPLYYMDISLPHLYYLPLFVGTMFVTAGSFVVASEKSPSRSLLKSCVCTNLAGLAGAMCALFVYPVSLNSLEIFSPCEKSSEYDHRCPAEVLHGLFFNLGTILFVNDLAALVVLSLLSFSALKGLRASRQA